VIDAILKSMDLRRNISARLKQSLAYADDILITSRTEQSIVETFSQLQEQSEKLGLIINLDKPNTSNGKKKQERWRLCNCE
jgi:hypothetical protein